MKGHPVPVSPDLCPLHTFFPLSTGWHAHTAHTEMRGTLCYFDLFLRWKDGALTRSAFFRRAFMLQLVGVLPQPSSSPGTRGSMRAPRPTRPVSPISQPPWENLKSGPDVAAGPATLEVKVKGNHVKFATHHHSLDREINRSGLGQEVRCRGEVGGVVGGCTAREKSNKVRWTKKESPKGDSESVKLRDSVIKLGKGQVGTRSPVLLASMCHRGNTGHMVDSCFWSVSGPRLVKSSHVGLIFSKESGHCPLPTWPSH